MKLQDLVKLKPIIEAIEQGKNIEVSGLQYSGKQEWIIVSDHNYVGRFGDDMLSTMIRRPELFRIKPEPREFYIAVEEKGCIFKVVDVCLASNRMVTSPSSQIIKVREVIE